VRSTGGGAGGGRAEKPNITNGVILRSAPRESLAAARSATLVYMVPITS
jgi:hypothetical protein